MNGPDRIDWPCGCVTTRDGTVFRVYACRPDCIVVDVARRESDLAGNLIFEVSDDPT
jgi:hypothetical protein